MIKGKNCDVFVGQQEAEHNSKKMGYEMDSDDAVANLIGVPNPNKKNYKLHNKFYNELYDYFIESGELAFYDLDPWIMSEQWNNYYNTQYVDLINKDTAQANPYRLKAMYNQFKSIQKKRNKILNSKKKEDITMSNTSKALLPPEVLAMKYDRYGFVSKVVKATKDISDKIKQSYSTFDTDVSVALDGYYNNAKALYPNANKNAVLDGLTMTAQNGELIKINGYSKNDTLGFLNLKNNGLLCQN